METEDGRGMDGIEFDFDIDREEDGGAAPAGGPGEGALAEPVAQGAQAGATQADGRPAAERIDELLARMDRQRAVLGAIMSLCEEPRTLAELEEGTRDVRDRHRSIFSVEGICLQLEAAGALERVCGDGAPYGAGAPAAEPAVEVVDGVECLARPETPELYWRATEEGRAAAARRDPAARLARLFEDDATYLPIYGRVLALCAQEGGAGMPALGRAVDADPLVQDPRFYAAHFVNNLEACDALDWDGAWVATEVGLRGLDMLAAAGVACDDE